jgi:hypothetical protein
MNDSSRNSRAQNIQGGRLLKWKGRIVSAAPGALLASVSAIALSIAPVLADPVGLTDDITTELDAPQVLVSNVDLAITDTGAIELASPTSTTGVSALAIELDYSNSFVNDGTISIVGELSSTATQPSPKVAGLRLNGDLLQGGTLSNTESISLNVEGSSLLSYAGIIVDGDVAGTINNSGTIEAYGLASAITQKPAAALGLQVASVSETGQILNSDTIIADADSLSASATAYGIDVNGSLAGLIDSSGTMTVSAFAGDDGAIAIGVGIKGAVSGTVVNSGTMTLSAFAGNSGATATGVGIKGDVSGEVVNSGTITVTAETSGYGYVSAYGMRLGESLAFGANVLNSGTIAATAIGNSSWASAYGINIEGGGVGGEFGLDGELVNSGTIEATVMNLGGDSGGSAYGILVNARSPGDLLNSRSITASVSGDTWVSAHGIFTVGGVDGELVNSGTIEATAMSLESGSAYGIHAKSYSVGNILNSGSITAALSGAIGGSAYGIGFGTVSGSIENTGSIVATVSVFGDATWGTANGVRITSLDGTFSNSGVITANVDFKTEGGDSETKAYGVYVEKFNGEITDLGTINVSGADEQYAVYLSTGTGTMNVDTEDNVAGLMRVEDHNVNLDAVGGSRVFRFEDANDGAGTFTTIVTDPTSAWFVGDEFGPMPIYAAVDSDDVAVNSNAVAALGAQLGAFSDQLVGGADVFSSSKTSLLGGALRPFASVGGQHIGYDTTSTAAAMDVNIANVTVGMSGTMGNGMDVAFGFGAFNASADTAATDLDAEGFYLGGSVGQSFGAFDLNAGLGFGLLASDLERTVSGETASSSFDSNFFTAHVGAERGFQMSNGLNLTGYGQVRFTRQSDDGYTETGSSANLTVGDMATDVTEFTLSSMLASMICWSLVAVDCSFLGSTCWCCKKRNAMHRSRGRHQARWISCRPSENGLPPTRHLL